MQFVRQLPPWLLVRLLSGLVGTALFVVGTLGAISAVWLLTLAGQRSPGRRRPVR